MNTKEVIAVCVKILDMTLQINNNEYASTILFPLENPEVAQEIESHYTEMGHWVVITTDEETGFTDIEIWPSDGGLEEDEEEENREELPVVKAMAAKA